MNKIKRFLALFLVLCMMLSAVPFSAFAAEGSDEASEGEIQSILAEETTPVETTPVETTPVETTPVETTVEETTAETTVVENQTQKESNASFGLTKEAAGYSLTISTKPADGTTTGQPFSSSTGGSTNFRIPALVTLSDGTLVAACDARWNHSSDGFGLDTIVSYSGNNGANWNYTFANYLGDNGNVYNTDSTAFIDPALAVTQNDTIFMLVDLYPHGTYIGNVKAGTGFDEDGHLLLSNDNGNSYAFYVGDFAGGSAPIYQTDGTLVDGYTVDAYYNISGNGVNTNLFFSDSPYQVLGTSYLYLTKSTDRGASWSAPMMLNPQVKGSGDKFYGVGPGCGLVTSTGRIMFPCYTYTTQDGNTSVIYSDDGGETWSRGASTSVQTSEAALVEADGRIYMFTRHGGYFVSSDNGETWGGQQNVGISYNTGCQISAITYSKKIDGKTAILLSAPGSTSSRSDGKIFVGLVQDDGSIQWGYTYSVTSGAYAYSCLTELADGSVGLLYESAGAAITYTNLPISDIASGAQIGEGNTGSTEPTEPKSQDITVYVGQSKHITDSTGNYQSSYTGEGLDTSVATVEVVGDNGTPDSVTHTLASVTCNTLISSDSDDWTATGYYYKADGSYYPVYAQRTTRYNIRYSYTWGYSVTDSANDVTQIGSSQTVYILNAFSTKPNFMVYSKTGIDGTPASTTITIIGVAPGNTSVTVGNTTYNITVKEIPPLVDIYSTPFVANTGVGDGKAVTKLTTSVDLTFDLDLNITGTDVQWSVADPSIATVDQNGNVTGVAAGETTVTATIDGVGYTIPVVIRQDATPSKVKTYDFYLSEVTDTNVYMSISTSTDLVEVQEGEAIYISFNSKADTAVDFFGTPYEGYALTQMSSTNSAGDYMALNSDDPKKTDFYTTDGAAGKNQRDTFGDTAVANMVQAALDKDCDGGMGWTRPSGNANKVTSDLTFRSEKLPTVEKEVATVNGVPYTEGMVARQGEKVVFNVKVTQYAAQDAIVYSNVSLRDNLTDAVFSGSKSSTMTITDLSNTALESDTTHTYQVEYTIKDADLDKTITNTVDLKYTYKSAYSSGSFGGTANAEAKITATSFEAKDIVIDFGLPVTVHYDAWGNNSTALQSTGTAKYGNVAVSGNHDNGWNVTYTPTTILRGIDTVTLYGTNDAEYTFKVYPATTVHYEESFIAFGNNWSGTDAAVTGTQQLQVKGQSGYQFGYDPELTSQKESNGSAASTSTIGANGSFTFTGTGFEIYADSNQADSWLFVKVTNADTGAYVYTVNTAVKPGNSGATDDQGSGNYAGKYYGLPVVSKQGLKPGNYTVELRKFVGGEETRENPNTVYIDGIRIFDTIERSNFQEEDENCTTYVELRNQVLAGLSVNVENSQYYDSKAKSILEQVYSASGTLNGAIVLSNNSNLAGNEIDLLDNGPKNELYLFPNQAVTFRLADGITARIGMHTVQGETSYIIGGSSAKTITSSTDMFYDSVSGKVTITNAGNKALAITLLKIFGSGDIFAQVDKEQVADAFNGMRKLTGAPVDPVEPTIPFLDVAKDDWFYDAVKYVYENGLMYGTASDMFSPNSNATRGMIVTILYRESGSPDVNSDGENWWSDARVWAMENGISDGTNMDANITREQMAAMLYRYAKLMEADVSARGNLDKFSDREQISDWAVESVQWAVGEKIIAGRTNGTLDPQGYATRAEVAAMLMRFDKKPE